MSDRRADVLAALNEVIDPCSQAAGADLGLLDMGIVDGVAVTPGEVRITLLPTFHGCLFVPLMRVAIEERLRALPWAERQAIRIDLAAGDAVWTERRLTKRGAARLRRVRARHEPRSAMPG